MEEGRQVVVQPPGVAVRAQARHDQFGDRIPVFFGQDAGPAAQPRAAQRKGQGKDKLIASCFQWAVAPDAQPVASDRRQPELSLDGKYWS